MSASLFVGRNKELVRVRHTLQARRNLLVSGVSGMGKTALLEHALKEFSGVRKASGRILRDWLDGICYFAEILQQKPRNSEGAAVSIWLENSLKSLSCRVFILDDFEYLNPVLARVILTILRSQKFEYSFVAISAGSYLEFRALATRDLQHIHLDDLSGPDLDDFCRLHSVRPEDLPAEVSGHPQLMQVYLDSGATGIEDWIASKLDAFSVESAAMLRRLAFSQTPLQEKWAVAECSPSVQREVSSRLPSASAMGRVQEYLRKQIDTNPEEFTHLSRSLLDYLVKQKRLSRQDFHRAIKISLDVSQGTIKELVAKYASDIDHFAYHSLVLLQPALTVLMLSGDIPAKSRLLWLRGIGDQFDIVPFLKIYDTLISSSDGFERAIAKVIYLRACYRSGLRSTPHVDDYVAQLCTAEMHAAIRNEAICLWCLLALRKPGWVRNFPSILSFASSHGLAHHGVAGLQALKEAYVHALSAGSSLSNASESFESARMLFSKAGLDGMVTSVERSALVWTLLVGDDKQTQAILGTLHAKGSGYDMFENCVTALLAWNHCDFAPMQRFSAAATCGPYEYGYALLPGPYYADYLPHVFRALEIRTLNLSPDCSLVPIFAQASDRLQFFFVITTALVIMAQTCMLHDDLRAAAEIIDILRLQEWPVNVLAVHLLEETKSLLSHDVRPSLEMLQACLRNIMAMSWERRYTYPYFILLLTRSVLRHRIPAVDLVRSIETDSSYENLTGFSRWIVERCCSTMLEVLGIDRSETPHTTPKHMQDIVMAQIWQNIPKPGRRPRAAYENDAVLGLKRQLTEHWNKPSNIERYAANHKITAKHLRSEFKKAYGMAPKAYQTLRRLEHARRLLRSMPQMNVTEIALECGFCDGAEFSHRFKQEYNQTPKAFRNARPSTNTE